MRIGVVFPQTEIGGDAGAARAYAEHVEGLGFAHLLAYDHILGADPAVHADWNGPYDLHNTFHEPLVTFGYLAASTTTLELVTGVIILPQRQTALVAKQAAEVDLLSGGRLRLGVGLGWRPPGGGGAAAAGQALALILLATVAFGGIGLLLAGTLRAEINLAAANQAASGPTDVTDFQNVNATGLSTGVSITGTSSANIIMGGGGADTIDGGGGAVPASSGATLCIHTRSLRFCWRRCCALLTL